MWIRSKAKQHSSSDAYPSLRGIFERKMMVENKVESKDQVTEQTAPSSETEKRDIAEVLERLDQLKGPMASVINAFVSRFAANPHYTFKNTLVTYSLIVIILFGLGVLTWFDKIGSDVLMLLVGLVIGILSHHVKALFPTN